MKKLHLLLFLLLVSFSIYAQNPEWINYTDGQNVYSTVFEGDYVWVGTSGGLVKLNKTTGEKTFFNRGNSDLPNNSVLAITIDVLGNKWIGTEGGLAKFDGTTWTVYIPSNSGLPINSVTSIAIDGSGNKWIGTHGGGLVKFDGTTWTVFNTSNSQLPDNQVPAIAIDDSGNKWIGTYNGGISKFDGTTWTVYNTSNSQLPDNDVVSIAIDGSGNKWLSTFGGGLAKFDGTTWTVYNTLNSDLPVNLLRSVAIDGSGTKWIGTSEGLAKFDGTTWSVYTTSNSGLTTNDTKSIAIDGSGNKWIGTYGGGLAKFDGTNWTVYNTSNSGLPDNYVLSIAVDVYGNKWIGSNGGLSKFNGIDWVVYNTSNSSLPYNSVSSIAIDAAGNKWLGTGGGLVKYDGTNWVLYNTSNSGIPSNSVGSIVIDAAGNKWFGTWDKGLVKFDGSSWTVYNSSNSSLTQSWVRAVAIDAAGVKWIGTQDGNLFKFDGTNWTVYNSGLPNNGINSITIDRFGNKWVGSNGSGLEKFDGTTWKSYDRYNSGFPDINAQPIVIDGSGIKWIGSVYGGLVKYDDTNWTVYNPTNSGLPVDNVNSLAIDSAGNKWIGTTYGGLAVYNENGINFNLLSLLIPNGSETWQAGSTQNITWTSTGITNVKLEYTTNSGTNWTTIIASTPASSGSYAWTIPNTPSTNCKVRISDATNAILYDESNGMFTVMEIPSIQDGSLDLTFSEDGKVITLVGSASANPYGVAIQSDGKIVVAGFASNGSYSVFAVVRYNSDGTLDTGFDGDGKVTTPIGLGNANASAYSVAIQSDGKIIAAGGYNENFAVVRYNTDGTLDAGFGSGGKVTTQFDAGSFGYSIAIQSDGKIVVAGYDGGGSGYLNFAVVRYNIDGTLDSGFGNGGKISTPIGSFNDLASGVVIQSDGKIVVAGTASNGSGSDFALVRYNNNGTLDTGFDGDGKVTTPIGLGNANASAYSVAIQADGKIIAAGGYNENFAIVRYNTDGTLDSDFDSDGKVTTLVGTSSSASSVTIQADGKIVVAGNSGPNFGLVRYNIDGTLDTGFDVDGKVVTQIGTSSAISKSVAIQFDGKIVVAGNAADGTYEGFAVVRYNNPSLTNHQNSIITLLAPNGGENWQAGSTQNITWTSTNVIDVKLDYTTDSGTTWTTIIASTLASSGSYAWIIPTLSSTNCKARISDVTNSAIVDTSDAVFSINYVSGYDSITYAGKIYHTVKIGNQTWLKENLDIGTMIQVNANASNNGTIEKYCYDNNPANCDTYGGLYQWNEAMAYITAQGTQGICPTGWHIPTNVEFETLAAAVSNNSNSLKAIGQGTGVGTGTNTSGFSALLAGYRDFEAYFNGLGDYVAYFWSSMELNAVNGDGIGLYYDNSNINMYNGNKGMGFSVRCLKNESPTATIQITSPNGGENFIAGTIDTIKWISTIVTNVKLEYTTNNGTDWATIIASTPASNGSYAWTIPNTPSANCKVKISDVANSSIADTSGIFTITASVQKITVTSPNGGERWKGNSSQQITWGIGSKEAIGNRQKAIGSKGKGVGSEEEKSLSGKLKVKSGKLNLNTDNFELTTNNSKSGKSILNTESQELTTNNSIENVRIDYSTDNGTSWTTIVSTIPASQSNYSWIVPVVNSQNCKIRVVDHADTTVADTSNAVFEIYSPQITVTSPNGGEQWQAGSSHAITWTQNNCDTVKISYSTNQNSGWIPITEKQANAGTYSWVVPSIISATCKVRISDKSDSTFADSSNAVFAITSIPVVQILVSSPNGGENWKVGESHNITWSSSNVDTVKLEFSTNNGTSWTTIQDSVKANLGTFAWTIPNTPSTQCKVRISDFKNSAIGDTSNTIFTIELIIQKTIAVTSPSGGENWKVGESHNITWTSSNVDTVKLEFSTNNGTSWTTIKDSVKASLGTLAWTIPNTPSTQCKVRISDFKNSAIGDTSNTIFTIELIVQKSIAVTSPNGGENWKDGSAQSITWTSSNVNKFKLEYTTNNGTAWLVVGYTSSSPYSWIIPNAPSAQCKVRISDSTNTAVWDTSKAVFTIYKPSILR